MTEYTQQWAAALKQRKWMFERGVKVVVGVAMVWVGMERMGLSEVGEIIKQHFFAFGMVWIGISFVTGSVLAPRRLEQELIRMVRELNQRGFVVLDLDGKEWQVYAPDGKRTIFASLRDLTQFASGLGIAEGEHIRTKQDQNIPLRIFMGALGIVIIALLFTALFEGVGK